ncbi:MAG: redoxin domain-containing protein [Melioribacteraceae bacterium]|nr:redoxin domain-containing protein [Melioribacteraceae bacterium]
MLKIGQTVPELKVQAFHNEEIKDLNFADYKGQWLVVVFYPADFTFICPTELEELAEMYPQFQEIGAEVLSVSTDTVFVHKAWHDTSEAIKKINFPMVADPTGKVSKKFGTYIKEDGLSLRGSFIIDPEGVLKAFEINDNSIGRNAAELFRKLQAAKFVSEADGEVCPANWTPGGNTLKPGLDLVGKI